MEQLRKLSQLSWQQQRVLFYACLLLNGIRLALWLLPFGQVRSLLARVSRLWKANSPSEAVSVGFIVRAVRLAVRCTPGVAMCLARALTTQALLDKYGYAYQLRIGVAKDTVNQLVAHAWIEYEGHVIMGALNQMDRYQPLAASGATNARTSP